MQWADRHALTESVMIALIVSIAALMALAIGLAGTAIHLRARHDRKKAIRDALERVWEPLILGHIHGDVTADHVWAAIPADEKFFFAEVLYRYVTHLLGAERQRLIELAQPCLPELGRAVKGGYVENRARAMQLVGVLGFEQHIEILLEGLDDRSPLVTMVAARALARPDHPGLARIVLSSLDRLGACSLDYLASIVVSLGPSTAAELRRLLGDDRAAPRVRLLAAEALIRLDDLPAGAVAAQVLHQADERTVTLDVELQCGLLRVLQKAGLPEHLPEVLSRLGSAQESVRVEAVATLGRLGSEQHVPLLLRLLEDPSPWAGIQAGRSIRMLGGVSELRAVSSSPHPRAIVAQESLEGLAA